MHSRLRKYALGVIAILQLEACVRRHLPPEDYGITEVVSCKHHEPDASNGTELAKK